MHVNKNVIKTARFHIDFISQSGPS